MRAATAERGVLVPLPPWREWELRSAATVHRPAAPSRRRLSTVLPSVAGIVAAAASFSAAVALHGRIGTAVAVLVAICTVPGWLVLRALGLRVGWGVRGVLYALTTSLAVLLVVIMATNAVLPPLGDPRPLAAAPMTAALVSVCVLLAVIALLRGTLRPTWPPGLRVTGFAPLAAPVATAAGTLELNTTGGAALVTLALVGTGGLLAFAVATARTAGGRRRVPVTLFAVSLSLLWSYSLRSAGLFGFDLRQEYGHYETTVTTLHWVPALGDAYAAMLSITAMPAALSQLTGLSGLVLFKVVYPVLFAFLPVGVYLLACRWLRPTSALVAACAVVLQANFAPEMPALARQEIALLMFVGLLLVTLDVEEALGPLRVLALLLGLGMIVSHYSTTYVALTALILARGVAVALHRRDQPRRRPVAGGWVVGALAVLVVLWYGVVTHSAQNLDSFAAALRSSAGGAVSGSTFARPGSWVSHWLSGNTVQYVPPARYFSIVDSTYRQRDWLLPYTAAEQARLTAQMSTPDAAPIGTALPGAALLPVVTTVLRQLINVGTAVGVLWTLWYARRRGKYRDLAGLAVPLLLVTVLTRTNAAVAIAYNPERLALQTSALMIIPFALIIERLRGRFARNRSGVLAAAALVAVVGLGYLDASGLGSLVSGDLPGNLSATGEVSERLTSTPADQLAAQWLGHATPIGSALYADRYGALLLTAYDGGGRSPVIADLAPGTLDRRAYVFATSSNVLLGRARGATPDGTEFAVYPFPADFLGGRDAVVYDTGTARIYK